LPIDQIGMIALKHIDSTPELSSRNFIVLLKNYGLTKEASPVVYPKHLRVRTMAWRLFAHSLPNMPWACS